MSILSDLRRLEAGVDDLVAKHEQAKNVTEFGVYADDPAGFLRDVLRCDPWEMQVAMGEAIRDHRRVVVVTANGLGKDWATARLALWWVYARRGLAILTGPTERQVKQILMREVRRAFSRAPELPGELYALELRADETGECGILAFTSDNADRLTGFHHPRLLICVTEGQGVEDEAYEAAQACCTSPTNRLFVYGNPTRASGPFVRAAENDSWHTLTIPATSHPNVISGREEIPGAVSREWIAMMRDEYGEASSIYKSRVLAQFPTETAEGLIQREWIRAAFARHESGELAPAAKSKHLTLSLDIARFGADSSVLAFVRGHVVEKIETWRGAPVTESVEKVLKYATAATTGYIVPEGYVLHRPAIVCDDTGLGGGATDLMRAKGYMVTAFNGAGKASPSQEARFLNARAESFWHLRTLLENNQIALPRDPLFEQEAMAVQWQINPKSGKIQMLSKDLIKADIGRSPDPFDAISMGLYYATDGRRMPSVSFESLSISAF